MTSAEGIIREALSNDVVLFVKNDELAYVTESGRFPDQLKRKIKDHRQSIIEHLRTLDAAEAQRGPQIPPIVRAPEGVPLPLSFSQQRLWFVDRLEGGSARYNMAYAFKVEGDLDVGSCERALSALAARHEVLRTTFVEIAGEPRQVVNTSCVVPIQRIDIAAPFREEQSTSLGSTIAQIANEPFDLSKEVMFRVALLRLSAREHVIVFVVHHIAADAWSLALIVEEFSALYLAYHEEREHRLPDLPLRYSDFALWQRDWLQGEVLDAELRYWRERLEGIPKVHSLPLDRPRPSQATARGDACARTLDRKLTAELKKLARELDVTLFALLQSAFALLVARMSGETDVVMGTPVAGRPHRDTESLVGFFVNSLVVRTNVSGGLSFADFVRQNQKSLLEDFAHQNVPFETLVEHLQPQRDPGFAPLFQIVFGLNNAPQRRLALPGLKVTLLPSGMNTARADLELSILESDGCLQVGYSYSCDLFDKPSIERVASAYATLLEAAVSNPKAQVLALPLLNSLEQEHLLTRGRGPHRDLRHRRVERMFEEQVLASPAAVAASSGNLELTYEELNKRANRLASYLRDSGLPRGTRLGIFSGRGIEQLIGVLGALKAGFAYVPLEPGLPRERLEFLIQDAQVQLVLTRRALVGDLPGAAIEVLLLDDAVEDGDWLQGYGESNGVADAGESGDDIAYVLYTSGSTGRPKGVMVTHRGVVNYLAHAGREYLRDDMPGAVVSSPLCFDATLTTFLAPLAAGKRVILLPDDTDLVDRLCVCLQDERAWLFKITPAHLDAMLQKPWPRGTHNARHVIVIGGEQLTSATIGEWRRRLSATAFVNEYGPTETVVGCSTYTVDSTTDMDDLALRAAVPVGWAIGNMQLFVLNEAGQLQPEQCAGELYIGGHGVARGYVNLPSETESRFVRNPFAAGSQDRLYRTGDLVRWLPDVGLEFIGRRDDQVKIRGYRVELGEIASRLREAEGVGEAFVTVLSDPDSRVEKYLVAYVVRTGAAGSASDEESAAGIARYRAHLAATLPDYMVPARFVFLDEMPLTVNGKVDRKRLPAPGAQSVERREYVPPSDALEERLCRIWETLLKVGRVGAEDNFFDLGGHSLLALRLTSHIREELHYELSLRSLFNCPTVAELAAQIRGSQGASVLPAIRRESREGSLPVSFAQQRLWFIDRAGGGSVQYNIPGVFRLTGHLDTGAFEEAFREIVRRHEVLRTSFAEGSQGPRQFVRPTFEVPVETIDLSHLSESQRQAEISSRIRRNSQTPFDLENDLLIRIGLVKVAAEEHLVIFSMHHIASDGWSLGILAKEFCQLYEMQCAASSGSAATGRLPELDVQYADYAQWQRGWLTGEVLTRQLEYWKERLEGIPQVHSIPLDRPRPARITYSGAAHIQPIGESVIARVDEACRHSGVTRFMFMQTLFALLLSRWSNESDIVMGTTVAGRTHRQVEPLIGFFVNTLVTRTNVSGDVPFHDLLDSSKRSLLDDFAHEHVPFEMLVEKLNPPRSAGHSPLVQVAFSFHNNEAVSVALPNLTFEVVEQPVTTAHFDLTLNVSDLGQRLALSWVYNTDLFDAQTIERLARAYRNLLSAVLDSPAAPVRSLPLVTAVEADQLVMRGTPAKSIPHANVHDLFREQVRLHGARIAAECAGTEMTYEILHERSDRLAGFLLSMGLKPETRVGVCLERSLELLIAILGIMKAGGAYVPLEPGHPPERIKHIVDDSSVDVVLLTSALMKSAEFSGADVVVMDDAVAGDSWLEEFRGAIVEYPRVEQDNLVYVLYTSGSTGKPKGVMITHGGLLNYLRYASDHYCGPAIKRAVVSSPLCFDATVTSLLAPLCCGVPVVLLPEERLLEGLSRHLLSTPGAALFKITPAHLEALAHALPEASPVQTPHMLVVGGEQFTVRALQHWASLLPAATFVNEYGPTETVVGCCTYFVRGQLAADALGDRLAVPIGTAIDETELFVMNEGLQMQPRGCVGELYIGGAGVARGYLNLPELTESRFVEGKGLSAGRLYKTGDLVRLLPEGGLEFLGRRDSQVKIRGFRIELEEIESVLRKHSAVRDAVVAVEGSDQESRRLTAYVTLDEEQVPAAARAIAEVSRSEIDPARLFRVGNGMELYGLNRFETEYVYDEIFVRRVYERHGIEVGDGDHVFDVGANIGTFAVYVATRYPGVLVHCFEPIPAVHRHLAVNAKVFAPEQIQAHCRGLSAVAQEAQFQFYPNASLYSGVKLGQAENIEIVKTFLANKGDSGEDGTITDGGEAISQDMLRTLLADRMRTESVSVQLSTISAEIARHAIERIDLLKIDVERSELAVLQGIEAQDWAKIRQVVVEVHDVDGAVEYVKQLLTGKGFAVVVDQDGELRNTELFNVYARRGAPKRAQRCVADGLRWKGVADLRKAIRQQAQENLPEYMVPASVVIVDSIPLTRNGKVDYAALAAARANHVQREGYVAPRDPVETTLCRVWGQLLGAPRVGVRDNFFELGGHSLAAIRLVSALRQEFLPARVELPLEVLFSTPTVEGIAQYIDRELAVERLAAQRKLLETEQTEIEEGDFE